MVEQEIIIGTHKIIATGSVVIPASHSSVSIKIQDLTFKFVFLYDGGKQKIQYQGGGQELSIIFSNPPQMRWVGKTSDFLRVGNLGDDDIGVSYFIYAAKNQSHMLKYTFVRLGSEALASVEEFGDE
ncbi:DUF6864 domain-containing function [Pseudomonas iridis]|uniref:DUF6864 domain-containing function n=1 Tax=Pseudomonas iridis TaxID=2710587 RepID=UPI0037C8DB7B